MNDIPLHEKVKRCWKEGIRIFIKPVSSQHYCIVVSKATRYRWTDIPSSKHKDYEKIDGIIYSLKIGNCLYKSSPGFKDEKWYDKVNELYQDIFKKLIKKETNGQV